jgi:hypothetical protein
MGSVFEEKGISLHARLLLLPMFFLGTYLLLAAWGAGPFGRGGSLSTLSRSSPEYGYASTSLPPDPRVAVALATLLTRQYAYYLHQRASGDPVQGQEAARKYNLFAAECPPGVFTRARLPRAVE